MKNLIDHFDASKEEITSLVASALSKADDGELFAEHRQTESLMFDNGKLKTAAYNEDRGFGLRAVAGEAVGYAHSGEMSVAALKRASDAVRAVQSGYSGKYAAAPAGTNVKLYGDENPLAGPGFEEKVKLLQEIDAYLRAKDPKVQQVTVSLAASWQHVEILRADGHFVRDVRPMVRFNVSVVVGDGDEAGKRLVWRGRAQGLWRVHRFGRTGSSPPTKRCGRRWSISAPSPPLPGHSTSCFRPAGRVSCCMRRSGMGLRAISTARKPRPSPA